MRIYEVTFDGRADSEGEWSCNWEKVNVATLGGAVAAIAKAEKEVVVMEEGFELRVAEVRLLAEAP